jgi:hypothetical protein
MRCRLSAGCTAGRSSTPPRLPPALDVALSGDTRVGSFAVLTCDDDRLHPGSFPMPEIPNARASWTRFLASG